MGQPFRWKARYTVLLILFVSWVVSFMDRMVLSVAVPYIAKDFHLNALAMGVVLSAFFASYSLSHVPGGLLADMFGVRRVSTVALIWWSSFTAITGATANVTQMYIARFLFGLGEGVYPACVFKTVAVWFPKRERATANGIRLAAAPFGTALSPLIVVGIMSAWGWRAVFYSMFIPGIIISVLVWLFVTDRPANSPRVSAEEHAEIEEGPSADRPKAVTAAQLIAVLKEPAVLKYVFVIFCFNIGYWGFTTWLPSYLVKARGLSMARMGVVASLPFFAGTVGCVLGGWVSDRFFARHRRVPIIAAQLVSAGLLFLTLRSTSITSLVLYQTLAGFFLNFFFTAFWALPMNTVAKEVMGVVSSVINMGGQVAAFVSPIAIGYLIDAAGGSFTPTFGLLIASILISCLLAFTLPQRLVTPVEQAVTV